MRSESWPEATNTDELHDGLSWLGFLTDEEVAAQPRWREWLDKLAAQKRSIRITAPTKLWIASERLPDFLALWPELKTRESISAPRTEIQQSREGALVEIIRGRLEGLGPVTETALADSLGMNPAAIAATLASLETEGFALRGRFTPGTTSEEWCERRLLARIHRYTMHRLRAEIEPVSPRDFMRFLVCVAACRGRDRNGGPGALDAIVAQLEGFEVPAGAWESEIIPARIAEFEPGWLDDRCLAGQITWARLSPARRNEARMAPIRTTPIALLPRRHAQLWRSISQEEAPLPVSGPAQTILTHISQYGACFFDELVDGCGIVARPGRECAGRTCRARACRVGQFCRVARTVDPFE